MITCCTIDYFTEWPENGLDLVAYQFLEDVEIDSKIKQEVIQMCRNIHRSAIDVSVKYLQATQRNNYVTPTFYLEFIRTFKRLLDKKRSEINHLKERYKLGIGKSLLNYRFVIY